MKSKAREEQGAIHTKRHIRNTHDVSPIDKDFNISYYGISRLFGLSKTGAFCKIRQIVIAGMMEKTRRYKPMTVDVCGDLPEGRKRLKHVNKITGEVTWDLFVNATNKYEFT